MRGVCQLAASSLPHQVVVGVGDDVDVEQRVAAPRARGLGVAGGLLGRKPQRGGGRGRQQQEAAEEPQQAAPHGDDDQAPRYG